MPIKFYPTDLIEQAEREENWTDVESDQVQKMLREAFEGSFQVTDIQRQGTDLVLTALRSGTTSTSRFD